MTIEASRLRIDVQEGERWRRTLNVTVPAELVREERDRAAAKLAKKLKLPGFRAGRVPASVIEKRFGPVLQQEILDKVVGEAYREALRAEALRPISEGEVESVRYEPEEDLSFTISFDIQPEIELARVTGFQATRPRVDIGDEDVERVIERLRIQNGSWRTVDAGMPVDGDQVSVTVLRLDSEANNEPRDYDLVLGGGDAIPDVEKAIATLEPGTTGEFSVHFPDEASETGGEEQWLRITLRERKVRDLPEFDDAFAQSLGDFTDVDALRTQVREDLQREADVQSETSVRSQILDQVVDANPFEVPQSMVDRYIESILGDTEGADPERVQRVREQLQPEAEIAVRRVLVIERVADSEQLRATATEIDDRIEEIANRNAVSPAEAYARLQKSGRLAAMEREITDEKVFLFLRENSQIEDQQ